MPNGDPRDGFFYPTLTLMMDSYYTSPASRAAEFVFACVYSLLVSADLFIIECDVNYAYFGNQSFFILAYYYKILKAITFSSNFEIHTDMWFCNVLADKTEPSSVNV